MAILIKVTGLALAGVLTVSIAPPTAGEVLNMTIASSVDLKPLEKPKTDASEGTEIACSCIKTARQAGVDIPIGTNAGDLEPNSKPEIGALILLSYPTIDHVAKILGYKAEGFLSYEGNYDHCIQGTRIIAYNDPAIRGFWKPEP